LELFHYTHFISFVFRRSSVRSIGTEVRNHTKFVRMFQSHFRYISINSSLNETQKYRYFCMFWG